MLFFILISEIKKEKQSLTSLTQPVRNTYMFKYYDRSRNKNPLYYWRSIGEYYIPARKCDALKSAALKSIAKIDNNSETTKFFHH